MAKKLDTYKGMAEEGLNAIIAERREELRTMRFSFTRGKDAKNPKLLRREIARALTELNARKQNA
jgi:ribosomal protein L29